MPVVIQILLNFITRNHIGRLVFITSVLLILGSVGIYLVEHTRNTNMFHGFGDALWWSIVTMTTVGYGDKYPISTPGRIISAVVMLVGIGFLGMFTATIASIFVERRLKEDRGLKSLKGLKRHIIICGWNQTVPDIISEIRAELPDKSIVIVADLDLKPVNEMNVHFVSGNPSELGKLEMALFRQAEAAIVVPDEKLPPASRDASVILTTLVLKNENPDIYVCAHIQSAENADNCSRAGADEIIVESDFAAKLLGQAVLDHGVTRVIFELMSNRFGNQLYRVPCPSFLTDHRFGDAIKIMKSKYDAIVLAVQREDQFFTNPDERFELQEGDDLIVIARHRPQTW
ncbi:TPA: potassium channel protein [Candidatus Poribacteria bacterium]|nr:potassium channel protein [Candidatus Poribacteria bacterium]